MSFVINGLYIANNENKNNNNKNHKFSAKRGEKCIYMVSNTVQRTRKLSKQTGKQANRQTGRQTTVHIKALEKLGDNIYT